MEDILASIRRILSEDEVVTPGAPPPVVATEDKAASDVLVLDAAMMVADAPAVREPVPEPAPAPVAPMAAQVSPFALQDLVAPEAAAAAASSVGSLMRTLAAERTTQVRSGGPTIEEIVREELRPLLKAWLDANLPPMVERLVRAEIERVVGRAAP
jgi:uncharacterized protein